MATGTYSGGASIYDRSYERHAETTVAPYRDVAGTAFLWIAWVIAFAFWAFAMSTFLGILRAIAVGGPGTIRDGVDRGGPGYLLSAVVAGGIILSVALVWGLARWATRDRRPGAVQATSAAACDETEGARDDGVVSRPPGAHPTGEGEGYRPA